MKVDVDYLKGNIIRDNDVYVVEDNRFLKNLVLSKTTLHPNKETSGHSHPGLEEVYFFKSGRGTMQLDKKIIEVQSGDIVMIPDGEFHKVFNNSGSNQDLIFVCVFQSYEREN
jgi:mannose-6-phosphate isomerase-like protein (cupin superfamily)